MITKNDVTVVGFEETYINLRREDEESKNEDQHFGKWATPIRKQEVNIFLIEREKFKTVSLLRIIQEKQFLSSVRMSFRKIFLSFSFFDKLKESKNNNKT